MSATQVRAAEVLLRKVIPDISAIQHSGIDGGPIISKATVELVNVK